VFQAMPLLTELVSVKDGFHSFTSGEKGLRGGGFQGLMGRWVGGTMGEIARRHRAGHGQRGRPATRGTNMKIRKGRYSGTVGKEVYVNSKHGQVVRSRPHSPSRPTPARQRARSDLSRVAGAWRERTDKQFAAWTAGGKQVKSRSAGETPASLTGYALFCKINCALAAAGLALVMDPPKPEKLRRNPVGELDIRNRGGVITLRLRVPEAPAKHTFVLGSPPCSAGRSVRSNYSTIGLLPAAVRGWSDITELYVKRFGVPPAGSRVFIRTRQLINGWQDDFKDTNAVVPRGKGAK
jgi:hypothetical protein